MGSLWRYMRRGLLERKVREMKDEEAIALFSRLAGIPERNIVGPFADAVLGVARSARAEAMASVQIEAPLADLECVQTLTPLTVETLRVALEKRLAVLRKRAAELGDRHDSEGCDEIEREEHPLECLLRALKEGSWVPG